MSQIKISALNDLNAAPASNDKLVIVDTSASETKRIDINDLFTSPNVTGTLTADGVNSESTNGLNLYTGSDYEAGWTHVAATGTSTISVGRNSTWGAELVIETDTKARANFASNGDISFYEDTGTTAKFFWDASAESLGIGTTSPATILDVRTSGTTAETVAQFGNGNIQGALQIQTNGTLEWGFNALNARSLTFSTNQTEAARIDAGGHLLIGKTAVNTTNTVGIEAQADGQFFATVDGNYVGTFNRLTSDGDIATFRKDGTNVGSIASTGTGLQVASADTNLTLTATNVNLLLSETVFRPFVGDDTTVDLGASNARWKNLYLSGGVYLGGTGAANLLDDYEEGTFTAVISDGTNTVSMGSQKYTKVGRIVTFILSNYNINTSSLSGNVKITGLPFASDPDTSQSASLYYRDGGTSAESIIGFINPNATEMIIRENRGSATAVTNVAATAAVTVFATVTYTAV